MMQSVYLECFSGISGNMVLGALIAAGLPESYLRRQLDKLGLGHEYELKISEVKKCGIAAVYVDVALTGRPAAERHSRRRHLSDILALIDRAALSGAVKENSKKIFRRLAEAEAKVHGTGVEEVHFHEVGAVDAVVDIVGAAVGLEYLKVGEVYTSELNVGSGFVQCSHGLMPVPAPATCELLRGLPYFSRPTGKELVTPTGAAIAAALGSGHGAKPPGFVSEKVAYGAGAWDLDAPNVLRLQLGAIRPAAAAADRRVTVMEANIDDLNPQVYAYVMEKLLEAGALDVWITPIFMKKGRPASTLSVMLEPRRLDDMAEILFTETTTIGVRFYEADRFTAQRHVETVETEWGAARLKISRYHGRTVSVTPEYEDCRTLAQAHGTPLKSVQQAVMRRWRQDQS